MTNTKSDAVVAILAMLICMGGIIYMSSNHTMPDPVRFPVMDGITVHQDGKWTVYEYETGDIASCRFIAGEPGSIPVCTERTP